MSLGFHWDTYKIPLIFLVTAAVVVPLFRRLRISPVLGFLIAGVALGPFGMGRLAQKYEWVGYFTIYDVDKAADLAEFGVVFLLFMIGLEISWDRLKRMRRLVFGLGALQVLFSTLVLFALVDLWFALPVGSGIIAGAALSLSSTAIVIPVLAESKRLNRAAGRTAFSVLLFQDLMVAPLLFIIPLVNNKGAHISGADLFWTWAPAVFVLFVLVLGGRLLLRPMFHLVAGTGSTEVFMAACLLVVVGASVGSAASGLSMGLGAFVAGLLLAETEFRREIEVTIEPFQGLLLGLFFLSTGAGLDIGRILERPWTITGFAFGLITVKAAILFLLARLFKLGAPTAGEVALLLAPGGEFAFLMIGAAIASRAIPAASGIDLMIVVTLTMAFIPFLGSLGARFTPVRKKDDTAFDHLTPVAGAVSDRVIVVGYGRVGTLVGQMLKKHDIPFVAADGTPSLVAEARKAGVDIYWGNATRADFLEKIGLATARALVVTMDAPVSVEQVVTAAHSARPNLTIVARARDAVHATHLYELGVTDAIPETIEASLQLAEAVLVDIGVPMGLVIASIHEKRDDYRKFLQPHGDRRREKRGLKSTRRVRALTKVKAHKSSSDTSGLHN